MSGGVAWMECVWKMRGSEWLQVCVGENRGGKERLAKNRTLQPKWKPSNSISYIIHVQYLILHTKHS